MSETQVTHDQGTVADQNVDTTSVATTAEVQPQSAAITELSTPVEPVSYTEEDIQNLRAKVRYQEEEIERQRQYSEFLKGAQQQDRSTPRSRPEFDPNGVPLFSEIDEYVEYKLAEERERAQEERLVQGLEEYGRRAMAEDPNFKERVNLAGEMMQYNPANMQIFLNEKTVEGKIKILELLAPMHPRYTPSLAKGVTTAQPSQAVDQAIEKLKANAQIPATLTGMASASPTTKLYSQMSPEEIQRELETLKRQA